MSNKKKRTRGAEKAKHASLLEKRRKNGKKMLNILLLFLLFEGIYQLVLQLEKRFWPLYPVSIFVLFFIVLVLFIIYFIMNRGEPNKKATPESLDCTLPYAVRAEMAEKYNKAKEKSAVLVYFIVPLSLVLGIDFIMIFVASGAFTI